MSTMSVVHGMTQPLVEGGVDSCEPEVPVTDITDMHYSQEVPNRCFKTVEAVALATDSR